jgi:hypothetical protein
MAEEDKGAKLRSLLEAYPALATALQQIQRRLGIISNIGGAADAAMNPVFAPTLGGTAPTLGALAPTLAPTLGMAPTLGSAPTLGASLAPTLQSFPDASIGYQDIGNIGDEYLMQDQAYFAPAQQAQPQYSYADQSATGGANYYYPPEDVYSGYESRYVDPDREMPRDGGWDDRDRDRERDDRTNSGPGGARVNRDPRLRR